MNTLTEQIKDHDKNIENPESHAQLDQFIVNSDTWITSRVVLGARYVLHSIDQWSASNGFKTDLSKTQAKRLYFIR